MCFWLQCVTLPNVKSTGANHSPELPLPFQLLHSWVIFSLLQVGKPTAISRPSGRNHALTLPGLPVSDLLQGSEQYI